MIYLSVILFLHFKFSIVLHTKSDVFIPPHHTRIYRETLNAVEILKY